MRRNELYHHGVKGMKWGVRKDRKSGESRYKRGRRLNGEFNAVKQNEYQKLKKENKAVFDKYYGEAEFIAKKYGLDRDDGGGGDTYKYSQKQLDRAGQRYMELCDKADYLNSQLRERSQNKAKKYISDTYGDTALSDIDHYQSVLGLKLAASFLAIYAGSVVAITAVGSHMNKHR